MNKDTDGHHTQQVLQDCLDGEPNADYLRNLAIGIMTHAMQTCSGERYRRAMALATSLHHFCVWSEEDTNHE